VSQEIGIGAALAKDDRMSEAYHSDDFYTAFARQAGAISDGDSEETKRTIRDIYKTVCLGINYGMGPKTLSVRIGKPLSTARSLIADHHRVYHKLWSWLDGCVSYATLYKNIWTVFGWPFHIGNGTIVNPRSLQDFLLQANGAEMLRLAVIFISDLGIKIIAVIHDAIMIESPLDQLDEDIAKTRAAMARASRIILDGFELRTDVKVARWPDHYVDAKGQPMWEIICALMAEMGVDLSPELGSDGCSRMIPQGLTDDPHVNY